MKPDIQDEWVGESRDVGETSQTNGLGILQCCYVFFFWGGGGNIMCCFIKSIYSIQTKSLCLVKCLGWETWSMCGETLRSYDISSLKVLLFSARIM